jgi:hypothetical protein
MDMEQLCGLGGGRVARFMFHDRVAFGGALIAIGWLYWWLEVVALRSGEKWAWWTFLVSGVTGFGSFLAYLGYGYLDWCHGLATLVLLPLYVGGLVLTRGEPGTGRESGGIPRTPNAGAKFGSQWQGWSSLWGGRLGWGRGLLVATAVGMILGGATILVIGMKQVFVPQDLRYLGLGIGEMVAFNNRLVPLIAHDRAGFGGAIVTCGILLLCCVWFGRPSRSLWQAVMCAGSTGFVTAIGVHPMIGYTEFSHLAPAYVGTVLFAVGIWLCHGPMCGGGSAGTAERRVAYAFSV